MRLEDSQKRCCSTDELILISCKLDLGIFHQLLGDAASVMTWHSKTESITHPGERNSLPQVHHIPVR